MSNIVKETSEEIKFSPIHMSSHMVKSIYERNLNLIKVYENEYQEKGWAYSAQQADEIRNENKFLLKFKK